MRFGDEFNAFYDQCLTELKARSNWSESFVPMLERYVTITAKLSKLNEDLVDEEITVKHTNRAEKTNEVTSPKWRMFLALNREATALADKLELSPSSAPVKTAGKEVKGGFETGPMRAVK